MTKVLSLCFLLGISAAALALFAWPHPSDIRHYSVDELAGVTCAELGEKHEDVIFAYHDAAIAHQNKTGAFEDDLGLPAEEVLPYVILMKKVIHDYDLKAFDPVKPFFHSTSVATPRLHSDFYAEITSVCASNPSMDAIEAMLMAAEKLGVRSGPARP